MKQSTAANKMVFMVDSTDHVSGKAGLTLTITASKNGAAFATITPTVTDRGSGWYNLALTTAHTDTLGDLAIHVTGTAADPTDLKFSIEVGDIASERQQALKEIYGCSGTVWCVSTTGNDTTGDGLTWATAYATCKKAASVAAAGDLILVSSGTIAEGNNVVNLPDGVSLRGAGVDFTIVTSSASLSTGCIIKPGTGSIVENMTIKGVAASNVSQACIGFNSSQTAFLYATARNLKLVADSDGFYFKTTAGSPAACRFYAKNVIVETLYDCYFSVSTNAWDLYVLLEDCHLFSIGPSTIEAFGSLLHINHVIDCQEGVVRMVGGTAKAYNSNTSATGYVASMESSHARGNIELYGVTIQASTASGSRPLYSLKQTAGTITQAGCNYDASKTSGTITSVPIHGVDVLQISGDTTAADNLETMLDGTGGQTLSLGSLVVTGGASIASSTGDALTLTSSFSGGCGLNANGSGSGAGAYFGGGSTGIGMRLYGGGSGGEGLAVVSQSASDACTIGKMSFGSSVTITGAFTATNASNDIRGVTLADGSITSAKVNMPVDGKTLQEALQIIAAVLAGEIIDAGTGTETFKGLDGSTDRVVVTVDAQGNRSVVVYP